MKWIINVILFIILVLGIWSLYAPDKSPVSKRIGIGLLIFSFIVAIAYNFHTFDRDPFSKHIGVLKPKNPKPPKTNNKSGAYLHIQSSQLFEVHQKNVIFQPFGPNVPFSFRRTDKGLFVSMIIRSLDNKVIAKIIDNEWEEFPKHHLRYNYDDSALEIIDDYDIPILQVEYTNPYTVKIGGIFRSEKSETSEMYPQFPSAPKPARAMVVQIPGGMLRILGQGGGVTRSNNIDKEELDSFIAMAKTFIKPWFDYSAKKPGVRVPPESEENLNLTKTDKKKYSKLTNEELQNTTLHFVEKLDAFLIPCKLNATESIQRTMDAKSGEDYDKIIKNLIAESIAAEKENSAIFDKQFRIEAILLRNELLARLPEGAKESMAYDMYELAYNNLAREIVASDLRRLAKMLPLTSERKSN